MFDQSIATHALCYIEVPLTVRVGGWGQSAVTATQSAQPPKTKKDCKGVGHTGGQDRWLRTQPRGKARSRKSGLAAPPHARLQFAPLTLTLAQALGVWAPRLVVTVRSVHHSALTVQNAGTRMCAPLHCRQRARPSGGRAPQLPAPHPWTSRNRHWRCQGRSGMSHSRRKRVLLGEDSAHPAACRLATKEKKGAQSTPN